jgi:hypothetical protein
VQHRGHRENPSLGGEGSSSSGPGRCSYRRQHQDPRQSGGVDGARPRRGRPGERLWLTPMAINSRGSADDAVAPSKNTKEGHLGGSSRTLRATLATPRRRRR